MAASDKDFIGSVPELYDRLLVPMLFDPYARDLAQRVRTYQPRDVLETAAGTGALTRAISADLGHNTRIVATDLNEPMLARARSQISGGPHITWQQADALALPFEDASFDVVACQFGVMFFPDRVAGYAESRRVLRPGGHFLFAVWDSIKENEFADVVILALQTVFPANRPQFLARTPHGYHDAARIRADLTAAGFKDIAIETITHRSRAASPEDVAIAYCQGTPMRGEIEALEKDGLDAATRDAAEAIAARCGQGPATTPLQAVLVETSK